MTEYFTVENEEGDRIDRYLAEEMPERSRSYLQKLIKEQYIKVNNKPVKANYRLVLGEGRSMYPRGKRTRYRARKHSSGHFI